MGGGPAGATTAIKCAKAGLKTGLFEKNIPPRHKPCGGVLPCVASEIITDIIDSEIPSDVFSEPSELCLFYVPPTGKKFGGKVKNHRVLNINRDSFDDWLLTKAISSGANVNFGSKFVAFGNEKRNEVVFSTASGFHRVKANIIVAADGVRSSVRQALNPDMETPVLLVGQEFFSIQNRGDIENCFYALLREDISPAYGYVIPKRNELIVGVGVKPKSTPNLAEALNGLKKWLAEEFRPLFSKPLRKEVWAIPFGFFSTGEDNVILVGDAAGFCNPFSGEGIRLAIESGEVASIAILRSLDGENLQEFYSRETEGLANFVNEVKAFVESLDDNGRVKFVMDELARRK